MIIHELKSVIRKIKAFSTDYMRSPWFFSSRGREKDNTTAHDLERSQQTKLLTRRRSTIFLHMPDGRRRKRGRQGVKSYPEWQALIKGGKCVWRYSRLKAKPLWTKKKSYLKKLENCIFLNKELGWSMVLAKSLNILISIILF